MIIKSFISLVFLFSGLSAFSQLKNDERNQFSFLMGNWVGTGEGIPGKNKGTFSFKSDLAKNVIVRRSRSETPAAGGKPASVHEDLLYIYKQGSSDPTAIYFDNEGNVINYNIYATDSSVVFMTDTLNTVMQGPLFRLTYIKRGDKKMAVSFEYAMRDKPTEYKMYVAGTAVKVPVK